MSLPNCVTALHVGSDWQCPFCAQRMIICMMHKRARRRTNAQCDSVSDIVSQTHTHTHTHTQTDTQLHRHVEELHLQCGKIGEAHKLRYVRGIREQADLVGHSNRSCIDWAHCRQLAERCDGARLSIHTHMRARACQNDGNRRKKLDQHCPVRESLIP